MSEKYEYKTVRKYARETIIEKKSRFIATVYPVTDEEDAIEKLNSVNLTTANNYKIIGSVILFFKSLSCNLEIFLVELGDLRKLFWAPH